MVGHICGVMTGVGHSYDIMAGVCNMCGVMYGTFCQLTRAGLTTWWLGLCIMSGGYACA